MKRGRLTDTASFFFRATLVRRPFHPSLRVSTGGSTARAVSLVAFIRGVRKAKSQLAGPGLSLTPATPR